MARKKNLQLIEAHSIFEALRLEDVTAGSFGDAMKPIVLDLLVDMARWTWQGQWHTCVDPEANHQQKSAGIWGRQFCQRFGLFLDSLPSSCNRFQHWFNLRSTARFLAAIKETATKVPKNKLLKEGTYDLLVSNSTHDPCLSAGKRVASFG